MERRAGIGLYLIDHDILVREALAGLLRSESLEVCGTASGFGEALEDEAIGSANVIILTPERGHWEAGEIAQVQKALPGKPILLIATHLSQEMVRQALTEGVSGFLVRWASPAELLTALPTLAAGGRYLHPDVTSFVVQDIRQEDTSNEDPRTSVLGRELEVLELVAAGLSNPEIARSLFVSRSTVKAHLRALFQRFGTDDRTRLVVEALRVGALSTNVPAVGPGPSDGTDLTL